MRRWMWMTGLLAGVALAAEPPAELLDRVADWADRTDFQRTVASVKLQTVSEELDDQGQVEHVEEALLRLRNLPGKDRPEVELLSATRDGKDNRAEQEEKQREQRKKSKDEGGQQALPFDRSERDKYRFTLLEPYPDDPEMIRVGFAPRDGKRDPKLYIGEAKLDPAQGAVRWLSQRPSKLPPLVDRLSVQLSFATPSPKGPLLTTMRFAGQGGLLFIRKRFRVRMQFSDYQLRP